MNFEDALQIAIEDKGFPDIEYANEVLKSVIGLQEQVMNDNVFIKFIESEKSAKDFINEQFVKEDALASTSFNIGKVGGINPPTDEKEKLFDKDVEKSLGEAVDGNVMAATDVPYRKGNETDGEATEKLTDETTPPISSKDFDDIDIDKKNPEDKKVTEDIQPSFEQWLSIKGIDPNKVSNDFMNYLNAQGMTGNTLLNALQSQNEGKTNIINDMYDKFIGI
jgi:hypothetical protein